MDYSEILELLPDWVAGRLDAATADRVRLAVEASAGLQAEAARLRAYYGALQSLPMEQAPEGFIEKVHERIEARAGLPGFLRRVFVPLQVKLPLELAGLAATVVLVVLIWNPFSVRQPAPLAVSDETAPLATTSPQVAAPAAAPAPQPASRLERAGEQRHEPARAVRAAPAARPKAALREAAADDERTGFTPEPEAFEEQEKKELLAAPAAGAGAPAMASAPAPEPAPSVAADKARPLAGDAVTDADELTLQRRQMRSSAEAFSVMKLSIKKRSIDDKDVREEGSRAAREGKSEAPAPATADMLFDSRAEKAFHSVEEMVLRHGGAFTIRSTQLGPAAERIYRVTIGRAGLEPLRKELKAMGKLEDYDLNLDASGVENLNFRLGVRVE